MIDIEHSRKMLNIANRDYKALLNMSDPEKFDDEIFGFHAQQAIEKTMKAWLILKGVKYPKIHDLKEIMKLLEENGEKIEEKFQNLSDFTDFAVEFRYDMVDNFQFELDRKDITNKISELFDFVKKKIIAAEEAPLFPTEP